jgi:hypothetical protein
MREEGVAGATQVERGAVHAQGDHETPRVGASGIAAYVDGAGCVEEDGGGGEGSVCCEAVVEFS